MVGGKEREVVGEWCLSCIRSVKGRRARTTGREERAEKNGPRRTGREPRAENDVRRRGDGARRRSASLGMYAQPNDDSVCSLRWYRGACRETTRCALWRLLAITAFRSWSSQLGCLGVRHPALEGNSPMLRARSAVYSRRDSDAVAPPSESITRKWPMVRSRRANTICASSSISG